jgi:glycosyltransferase involved in cell wall biosynthesis
VSSSGGLRILFAAENLLPAAGGAERFCLEVLTLLAARHDIRARWLGDIEVRTGLRKLPDRVDGVAVPPPPKVDGYWLNKRLRAERVAAAVDEALHRRRADVVVTQLHAAPAVIADSQRFAVPSVLLLPSYESFCKYAFDAASECQPSSGCRDCPRALALSEAERAELWRAREAHEAALGSATALVAPSNAVADLSQRWCRRRPVVVPWVTAPLPPKRASLGGHVLLAAAQWNRNKGLDLLVPIAKGVASRRVTITTAGLGPENRRRLTALPNVILRPNAALPALVEGAAVVLMPSQWAETFGRIAFEALSAGVPVLASRIGGPTEFLPPELLIDDYANPRAWTDAVESLEHPGRWDRARRRGLAMTENVLARRPVDRIEAVLTQTVAAGP